MKVLLSPTAFLYVFSVLVAADIDAAQRDRARDLIHRRNGRIPRVAGDTSDASLLIDRRLDDSASSANKHGGGTKHDIDTKKSATMDSAKKESASGDGHKGAPKDALSANNDRKKGRKDSSQSSGGVKKRRKGSGRDHSKDKGSGGASNDGDSRQGRHKDSSPGQDKIRGSGGRSKDRVKDKGSGGGSPRDGHGGSSSKALPKESADDSSDASGSKIPSDALRENHWGDTSDGQAFEGDLLAKVRGGKSTETLIEEGKQQEEEEQTFTAVDISVGCTLIGGLSFVFVLFSLVNYEDDDIRQYAWALVSMVGAIFVGVMIFEAVNRWVLHYSRIYKLDDPMTMCGVQYAQLFLWVCALQLTLAISSGTIGEGSDHTLELEQWVIADAMRADHGTPVYNASGDYDESVVRNRTGTKSIWHLNGIEVPVEKKKIALEQRYRRMKCWSTLLAHMCAFAAIHTGGYVQHLEMFAQSPIRSVAPLFINQIFIHTLFLIFDCIRGVFQQQAAAKGRKGVRAAMFDDFATEAENDISSLAASFLLVQSIRYAQVGTLPTLGGELDHTPWNRVIQLFGIGAGLTLVSVMLIMIKSKCDFDDAGYPAHVLKLWASIAGNGYAWCWLFGGKAVFLDTPALEQHGVGMETISGRILLALIMSSLAACLIFVLDFVNDIAKRASPPGKSPGQEIVAQLVFAKSILVGFSWEHSFEGGVEAIANMTSNPLYTQSGLALFMFFIVVPSWRRHILRKSLMLEDYRAKRNRAELEKVTGYAPVPSSPRDQGGMDLRSPQYSALPTEPPDDNNGSKGQSSGQRPRIDLSPEDLAMLGMAKSIDILGGMESKGVCAFEKGSVYGAAIAIPQIARSAGWPQSMIVLTMRAYLFVVLNYFVQTMFVYYIYDSQTNMNPFGGQMHLCDFASHIDKCPHAGDCYGPGGENIADPGALYPFDIWYTRNYVRDALIALFPDRSDDIASNVDPGEYGLESYYCRLLCVFVFVLQIADEFQNIMDLIKVFRRLPSKDTPWVSYEGPSDAVGPDPHGKNELELVHYAVDGIPLRWKLFNTVFLLVPRIFIWRMLAMAGVNFLMETAAMVDQIINTTALSFVLTTDELILERLATKATKHMMSRLEDYELFVYPEKNESVADTLERYRANEMGWCFGNHKFPLLPKRLFWTLVLMAIFVLEYYMHNCKRSEENSWVSVDVFLPTHPHLDLMLFAKKFFSVVHPADESNPVWSMPVM